MSPAPGAHHATPDAAREVTLLEVLDRILDRGVVLAGDVTISVADVDLIFVGLKLVLASVERAEQMRRGLRRPGPELPDGAWPARWTSGDPLDHLPAPERASGEGP